MKRHPPKLLPLPARPQLTLSEAAELETVIRNGMLVSGTLASRGQLAHAGAVDSLIRTIQYLRNRFDVPKPAPPPAPPAPPEGGEKKA